MAKLKKVAPQVVAKMGFKKGGLAASLKKLKRSQGSPIEGEISPRMKKRIEKKIEEEKLKNKKSHLISPRMKKRIDKKIEEEKSSLLRRTPGRRGKSGRTKERVYKV